MHSKWTLIASAIVLVVSSNLSGVQTPILSESIATGASKNVLGATVATLPSQVADVKIVEQKYVPSPTPTKKPYGKSRQINNVTWTIDVPADSRGATPAEILAALNIYRQKKGVAPLAWDQGLANFAQSRASSFAIKSALDGHAGFLDFVNNQDGFHKVGFGRLGENSAIGFTLDGTHLIEWAYAGDKPHDDNQLSSKWDHVGIGVSGTASDLVFGGGRL